MNYRLRLYPYCGGHIDLLDDETLGVCRRRAARRIRMHRNAYDYPVAVLERGLRWELQSDPDGYHMISDGEGILCIEEMPETAYDTKEGDDE